MHTRSHVSQLAKPITRLLPGVPYLSIDAAVKQLFTNGEQGAWYDPSDMSTLFQDAAGTTPVTAMEQPVGKILDKSGRGNHAYQSGATTLRPTLSARYNLLTYTEQFANAAWVSNDSGTYTKTITPNAGVAPNGTNTAYLFAANSGANGASGYAAIYQAVTTTAGYSYKAFAYFKAYGPSDIGKKICLLSDNGVGLGRTVVTLTDSWQRVSAVNTAIAGAADKKCIIAYESTFCTTANNDPVNVLIWGASFGLTDQASLPYQRVGAATDYDTSPVFKPYIYFDGTDDSWVTNSIDFTGTDKMTVFAGVRKLSDAAAAIVAELSTGVSSNNGSFWVTAPVANATTNYEFRSKGTLIAAASYDNAAVAAPITGVLTGQGDISGDSAILRVNGAQVASSTADQGTGNYGNYPLYIGRRGGTTLPFKGNLYSLIVRGAASSAAQVQAAENYVNTKTGAF